MSNVAIVTDSTATVPEELVRELEIQVVPLLLTYDGQAFRDGVDITPGEVYRWQRVNGQIPTTSSPSVGDFLRVYAAAGRDATDIVSIHLPRRLSATCDAAVAASRLLDGVSIHVINSHSAAMGQGFVVLEAARVAASGADPDQVIARATQVSAKVELLVAIETLKYLHRGGRIGRTAMLLGTILQINPIVYLVDDRADLYARPRTRARAIQLILRRMAEMAGDHPLHVAIVQADVPQEADDLRQKVAERFNCAELYVTEFTPVMGAHTGPGVLGAAFYVE